jgi:HD superfamily phosphohydrolase
MSGYTHNKRKIFNDPVYGFISTGNELIFDVIEHPWFQRLRRIKQLGLTHLVYPGALHTRFHHSMGAMHLIKKAMSELQNKGHKISGDEFTATQLAMLLHDIGHGPYSHALEKSIVNVNHETISLIFMQKLNAAFNGKLKMAMDIFENRYGKRFLHRLVSSQFDMDRLDYLKRDSFFTGVSEGVINYERLLNMLEVANDRPVIEAKGIYSVEKFITARRLMYWQVYLHKTVLVAEYMLTRTLKRAKELAQNGVKLFATPAFSFFLINDFQEIDFFKNDEIIENFAKLDDYDIYASMKVWCNNDDKILSDLSNRLVNRRLFKIEMQNVPFDDDYVKMISDKTKKKYRLNDDEIDYYVFNDVTSNYTYQPGNENIGILYKNGEVKDITQASDHLNINLLSKPTTKYFLCYPKSIV